MDPRDVERALALAVERARDVPPGRPADYIPELALEPAEHLSLAAVLVDGTTVVAGDDPEHRFTLQSSAKLVLLLGMLEERGEDEVFGVVGAEPSGTGFASASRLELHGPRPANPFVNDGAIALCGRLEGGVEDRLAWIGRWAERLYGERLAPSARVLASERATADKNRALAYLLKSTGMLSGDVDEVLEVYFALCSLETTVARAARLPAVLAGGGVAPGGERVVSAEAAACTVSLLATSGMYDESGTYLRETGLPAKSGVSGVIVAVAPGRAGLAAFSPGIGPKGGSVRGRHALGTVSRELGWHFARR